MNAKLTILANGKPRTLTAEQSLSIEFQNPMLTENAEMFSYPIELPLEGNRDLLKNLDDINSDIRPVSLEHTPMQIIADGIPFASGPMVISEDEEIDSSMSINIDASTEDFNSMIGDLTCRDIPIPEADWDSLVIGEKLSDVKVDISYRFNIHLYRREPYRSIWKYYGRQHASNTFDLQALGFSYPAKCEVIDETTQEAKPTTKKQKENVYRDGITVPIPEYKQENCYINVTDEYKANARNSVNGGAKYCNARVCYKHYKKDEDGQTSSETYTVDDGKGGPEDRGVYWVLDAHRPQSGICFYVLYFLECLFKHLKVNYDISALEEIEDMKHLCFYTTKCSYRTRLLHCKSKYTKDDEEVKKGLKNVGDVKESFFSKEIGNDEDIPGNPFPDAVSDEERKHLFDAPNRWLSSRGCGGQLELEPLEGLSINEFKLEGFEPHPLIPVDGIYKVGDNIDEIYAEPHLLYAKASANIVEMIADEGNFPEMSVSSLLSSLENMFGIKFAYDYEQKKVTAYLLRNVLRQDNNPRKFHAQVLSTHKVTEKITGVRIGYSEEEEAKKQKENIKYGIKNYDTAFNYIDYPDPATADKKKTTVLDKIYSQFFRNPSHGDECVYIDQRTGNAYRIKINSDYTDVNDMHPVLFEVGQYKGVEEGDCSEKNDEFVREYMSDLLPVDFTDVNYNREKGYVDDKAGPVSSDGDRIISINESAKQPLLAAYMDEDMEHEFVEQRIRQNLAGNYVNAYLTEVLNLVESYNPSDTDDGNSPLQHYDWGNSIAMMRGGGADSTIEQFDSNYDGFGNNKWMMRAGLYALTSDSIDQWQEIYDYNGEVEGGYGEHFSLKPRAYKQPSWADHPLCAQDVYDEKTGERIRIQSRGYVDTFLKELIYFLLNRKKYRIRCLASVAQIADIPNHWHDWWLIDGKKCLINRVNCDLSVTNGLGEVELEVYAI